jgi:hypothetical protein
MAARDSNPADLLLFELNRVAKTEERLAFGNR